MAVLHGHRRPRAGRTVVLLAEAGQLARLDHYRPRPWDAALAKVRGFSLDARLAAGVSPDSDPLLAVRSGQLVAPQQRRRLASDWGNVVRAAAGRRSARHSVPVCQDRVIAAAPEIGRLQDSLRTELPVPVRGVALATQLLTDVASPVYNRRSAVELGAAVHDAVCLMDPTSALLPGG